ncbi:aminoglycoside phosphotransferase family protein [Archangium gephyra]|uniref:phosphotransferase n=1 Tax=Archangium gephyra TaxID=48 RepID=UPI0035D4CB0F
MHPPAFPEALEAFVRTHLGSFEVLADHSWPHGESRVWELRAGPGRVILKEQRRQSVFDRERHALVHWAPALGERSVQLVASDGERRLLLLTAVPGQRAETLGLEERLERDLHAQAGELLARLHAQAGEDTPFAPSLRQRFEAWAPRAEGLLDAATLEWVRRCVEDAAREPWPPQVPCHWDFTARNWLAELTGGHLTAYVIDYGNARLNPWLRDLTRLYFETWGQRPDLRAAFFHGYGRPLEARDEHLVRVGGALEALTTVVWAREHGDAPFEARGREILGRLVP